MHLCVISDDYPSKVHSNYVFVQQLCDALADLGIRITVIAPQSVTKALFGRKILEARRSTSFNDNNKIEIYRPYSITISNISGSLKKILENLREFVICNIIDRMESKPDILYGHFWHNGYAVFKAAKRYKLPLFVASGESEIQLHKHYSSRELIEFTKYVRGVVCVSTKNKVESIKNGLTTEERCTVIPNAFNKNKFFLKDKYELRKKFGYRNDAFIVAFTGAFIHRKGAKRISDAITYLNDIMIQSIFIGGGIIQPGCEPDCDGILFKGKLPHDEIVDYLNCADVFVLPTLSEGSNNAIIEAMACGLPIISSDRSFNHDILNATNSILIDPMDIQQIANAIQYLKDNPEVRNRLAKKALIASQKLDISERALKIKKFIEQKSNNT